MKSLLELFKKYKSVSAYLFFGGLTTLINLLVYAFFTHQVPIYYQWANFWAWFLSVLFAFFTNKVWVFGSHYSTVKNFVVELVSFFFYRALSYVIDAGIMYVGVSLLQANGMLTKLVDQVIIVILNYVFSKYLIFVHKHK